MAEWLGAHRGIYVLVVLLFLGFLWGAAGLAPLRRLIDAERHGGAASPEAIEHGAMSVGGGAFALFLVTQFVLASWHLWPSSHPQQYMIWVLGAGVVPFVAYRTIRYLAQRGAAGDAAPKQPRDYDLSLPVVWQPVALVSVFLLSLPVVELSGFKLWAWMIPVGVVVVGTMLRRPGHTNANFQ